MTAKVSARAARSASSKNGASRHAATAAIRSVLSPALTRLALWACTHAEQPLIWLARSPTISCSSWEMPPALTALKIAPMPFMPSGST
ncbi:hypothetical protein ACTIVE_0343 [Actinomadura verrucosospora]|uniref:Uncharacterized protein n=1 Tax=Actinomadura verrucosospora TaxID=46165 RepID=A0A7D4AK90_ACTVE|nr:hypothetical protein ACTIVE_0343 [Actinomadura verrucosospora]